MKPIELHVYDFDGALYDSPRLKVDRPDWWYSAKSLRGHGTPGADPKWILGTVIRARRSIQAPWVRSVLLTGRPEHGEMMATIKKMLAGAGLRFDRVQLKPIFPPRSTPEYKAMAVLDWARQEPSISKIVFYDDLTENLEAVGAVVQALGLKYEPVLTPGVS